MCAVRISVPGIVVERPQWPALRAELNISDVIPKEVQFEAVAAAERPMDGRPDRTDLPLFTLDPDGSMDLDQAMSLQVTADGYCVFYAIADVAFFVDPGSKLDQRAHAQGETFYGPDLNVVLHPTVISEGAGSLLPQQPRPALLWEHHLDTRGELVRTSVSRAVVRSRRRLSYEAFEAELASGASDEQLHLLQVIGELREGLARERNAVDLPTPEQVVTDGPDGPQLAYRAPFPCEGWNAQMSLLTGMAAATLLIDAKVGMLRTLPQAKPDAVASLRLSAKALDIAWPDDASYGEVVSDTDPNAPNAAAFLTLATRLLRGAAYTAFNGDVPARTIHSGVGAPYAHCTAPLRRMADRYVNEICLSISAGVAIPSWVTEALARLPSEMTAADQRAHALERAVIEAAEAFVMSPHVGEVFDAVVVEVVIKDKSGQIDPNSGAVQLRDPAVRARCTGVMQLGQAVRVRCVVADLEKRTVLFAVAES